MGVGFLKLDHEYIKKEYKEYNDYDEWGSNEHYTGQWNDEPKNSALRFQFDPNNVKFSINTKWKESAASDTAIQWEYDREGDEKPGKITMTLVFDDRVADPGTSSGGDSFGWRSAQRSAEILEAWATPIFHSTVQRLLVTYEQMQIATYDWPWDFKPPIFSKGDQLIEASEKRPKHFREIMGVQTATVSGLRMSPGAWHAPRPLLLHLFTSAPVKCVLTELELDIVAIDVNSGNPLSIEAKVTFEEWPDYNLGNGLVEDFETQTLETYKTLDAWTKAVQSGAIKQTLAPRWVDQAGTKGPVTGNR